MGLNGHPHKARAALWLCNMLEKRCLRACLACRNPFYGRIACNGLRNLPSGGR